MISLIMPVSIAKVIIVIISFTFFLSDLENLENQCVDRLSVWTNFELARSAKRQNIHRRSINPITIFSQNVFHISKQG